MEKGIDICLVWDTDEGNCASPRSMRNEPHPDDVKPKLQIRSISEQARRGKDRKKLTLGAMLTRVPSKE